MTDHLLPPALPHSLDAERTVLGALLLDPDRTAEVAAVVGADDFYDPVHRSVYAAIRRLSETRRAADYVTVAEELKDDPGVRSCGGAAFLMELCNAVPTASHAVHYAGIV